MKYPLAKPPPVLASTLFVLALCVTTWAQAPPGTPNLAGMQELCNAERGELAPESTETVPVLRFAVTSLQGSVWSKLDQRGTGYLYVSRDRIRFSPGSKGERGFALDAPRTDLNRAKEWTVLGMHMGWEELQFRSFGKWFFGQLLCSAYARGESPEAGDPRVFQDLREAVENFDAAVARVTALTESRREAEARAKQEAEAKAKQEAEAKAAREAAERAARFATLRITAQPGGAQVYLDDKFKGVTSDSEGVLVIDGLQPTPYKVRISSTGYKDWTESTTLAAGETRNVEAKLAQAGPKPLSSEEIEEALRNGIPNRRVQGFVKQFGVDFALTDEVEKRLRAVGADSDLLLAITKVRK